MQKKNFIQKLLSELSYRSKEGYPILSKKEHLDIISDILNEWNLNSISDELIFNLTEGADEDVEYKHVGQGFYVKAVDANKEDAQKFTKDDNGKYTAVSNDEYEKQKEKAGEEGGPTNNPNAEPQDKEDGEEGQGGVGEEQPKEEPEKGTALQTPESQDRFEREAAAAAEDSNDGSEGESKAPQKNISKENGVTLKRVKEQIEKNGVSLTPEQKKIAEDCYNDVEQLFDDNLSDEQKREIADKIRTKYNITTNAGGTKFYINTLGGKRKIFGDGTKSTENLVNQLAQYTQLDQTDVSGIKKNLTAAAKPDLGKDSVVTPKDNPNVKQLFESSPVLSRIRENVRGVFAPKDADGNIVYPSHKHPRAYLEQSFKNPALTKTIDLVKQYVAEGHLSQEYLDSLVNHQNRLSGILTAYEIPSEDSANAIADSYNDLMVDLHNADSEAASAVMKQLAENRLYEESLARGEEVYLPSNGSFPVTSIIVLKCCFPASSV
jgi:hypothetical protein